MVDIHSHILWGLDDGAATLDESLAMVRLAADTGTTDIVATPHANHRYPFQPALIEERLAELRALCPGAIRIHAGCDFHLSFQNIEDCLLHPARYTVAHGRYLLVEFPDESIPPQISQAFERMTERGIRAVITHPERNPSLSRDSRMLDACLEVGCLLQITAQSLEGRFGRTARDMAARLIGDGKVQFIASDGHDLKHRPPRLDLAWKLVVAEHGEPVAKLLFEENPRRLIEDAEIPPAHSLPEFRRPRKLWRMLLGN